MTARLLFRRYSGTAGASGAFNVSYLIPDRDKDGYGLSPQLVDRAAAAGAELIITVDNGISSVAAVEHAKTLGIEAVVTDHHLPGDEIPDTLVVNPNQRGDTFRANLWRVWAFIFYVLIAVRSALRAKGAYPNGKQPNLQHLIDLVALGTVADVVPLDRNNRILVSKGLDSIRAGKMQPGVSALLSVAGKNAHRISANDLGYILGPRINAAGRLDSINKGVECLTSYDYNTALFTQKNSTKSMPSAATAKYPCSPTLFCPYRRFPSMTAIPSFLRVTTARRHHRFSSLPHQRTNLSPGHCVCSVGRKRRACA